MQTSLGITLLADAALKGTVILLCATSLVVMLRRASAASRHMIWQFAVIAMLTLPIIKVVSPLELPLLPQLRSPIVRADKTQAQQSSTLSQPQSQSPSASPSASPSKVSTQSTPTLTAPAPQTPPTPPTPWTLRALHWIALVWLMVAAGLMLRLMLGFVLVRWFALRAYPLYEDGWAELNEELTVVMGLRRTAHLYASPHVATPMTWGILNPVVMMPSAAEDWSMERRRVVLLHELAHVRRRDSLMHMIAQVACAVYWFHPLVWKAAARMRAEAERASDDLVLRAGTKPSVYADHLLELIRTIGGMRTPALALPMAQRSTFEGRLLAILEPHLDRTTPRRLSVAGMIVVAGMILFPLAGLTTANGVSDAGIKQDVALTDRAVKSSKNDLGIVQPKQSIKGEAENAVDAAHSITADGVVKEITHLTAEAVSSAVSNLLRNKTNGSQERPATRAAVNSLAQALRDDNADVRLAAAQSLGEMEDSVAVAALSNALRTDADARVRKMAAWALGNIESEAGVSALLYALKNDKDIEVRRTAVWALGQIEDSSAVDGLAAVVVDSDKQIRSHAVWALGQIEDRRAIPVLTQALRDNDAEIRRQAAWALGQIEDESAVAALSAALRDSDAEVRSSSVWALGQIESPRAVPALSSLANDASVETRKQVAWALGQIEDAGAVPALNTLLRDDKAVEVRSMAAWALGQIESSAAIPALSAALKDAAASVRNQAAWAMGQIEPRPAPPALMEALKDSDKNVRVMAAWALMRIEDPNAAPALRGAMKDSDPAVRQAVLHALISLGDQIGYEVLAEMLKDSDPEVRRAAAAAMGGKSGNWPNPQPQPQPRPQPRPRPMPQPIR